MVMDANEIVTALLTEHTDALKGMALALLDKETLDAFDIRTILENNGIEDQSPLPEIKPAKHKPAPIPTPKAEPEAEQEVEEVAEVEVEVAKPPVAATPSVEEVKGTDIPDTPAA